MAANSLYKSMLVVAMLVILGSRHADKGSATDPWSWQEGWLQLFDRHSTFGWRQLPAASIDESGIQLRTEGPPPRTSAQFADFHLIVRYQLSPDGAAQLLLRSSPAAHQPGRDHLAVPLEPGRRQLTVELEADRLRWRFDDQSQWQQQEISGPGRGYLGFRLLGGQASVEDVWLRPAPGADFLPDISWKSWKTDGLGAATLTDGKGWAGLRGGPGYLETPQTFADFLLTIEARTGPGANSGIFFRCVPGEALNGYESQIHNQFLDDDRERPADGGTGGIFRRVDARRVVADDGQWFRKTVLACGGQISVWVNGEQVTDWSDQRRPHSNPRRGRRLEAGTIMVQAHDPDMEVDFRRFEIQELPPR